MVVGDITTGTEVLVIGGGPGGYAAAARAAHAGKEVTLVEQADLGGVCLHCGCIPSKALIASADLVHQIRAAAERGIDAGQVTVDLARMQAWKQKVVERLQKGVAAILKEAGVQVVQGRAVFTGANTVSVDNGNGASSYRFQQCVIATGSRPTELQGFAFDGRRVLSSTEALSLAEIPAELVVVGGGYIGLELGMVYAKLGSRVTVVEFLDQVLPGVERELVQVVERSLRRLNVQVHTGARALGWDEQGGKALVRVAAGEKERIIAADRILVAAGRKPNADGLGLDLAGVELDELGFIRTDGQCRTSAPHIYAIGDVAGPPMLAHKASKEAQVAAEAIAGLPAAMDPVTIPAVIFTDPEIACAGLTAAEAEAAGYDCVVGKFPFAASGRALTRGSRDGFIQVVAERESGLLLGVQIVGPEASELISEAVLALEMGARAADLALTVHPHPTLAEGMMEAAEAAVERAAAALTGSEGSGGRTAD